MGVGAHIYAAFAAACAVAAGDHGGPRAVHLQDVTVAAVVALVVASLNDAYEQEHQTSRSSVCATE